MFRGVQLYMGDSYEEARRYRLGVGLSPSFVDAVTETARSFNEGIIWAREKRSAQHTTTTTPEQFAEEVFQRAMRRQQLEFIDGRTDMLLSNKNAVIYGAGGVIGSADARALAREGSIPDGQEEQIVTQEFGTQRNSDVTFRSMLSRRAMLRGLAATAIAATGQARAGNAFANADPAITPFTYHAPQTIPAG